ncbi:DUF2017 domain-containing protein [Microbacterium sp. KUDC0406]|uniref:DUF2017 family protein n=1 Tax=Microbacterium sp. KUDC0406 TaxID=2909588 RepID=UPI001F253290|nr:DUF2017 family protein [Microbacterium sp. KUDC0406]UJP11147.1 DUF2017 domain-containing protein [Microbacterium sp. KUDC0406]
MSEHTVVLPLAVIEGQHLIALLDEFLLLAESPTRDADAALQRLTPNAYPDDEAASQEYSALTRGDLLDRRVEEAALVRADLAAFDGEDDHGREDAMRPRDAVIPGDHLDAWLRTITALRLVLASRIGIETADTHDPDDPRYGVYDWLGYRLEGLIQAADERDARF